MLLIYICGFGYVCECYFSEFILLNISSTFFCSPFLFKTRRELFLFATTGPITNINGVTITVVVRIITDKLVFVFASGDEYMKGHNTLIQIGDAIMTNPKPPNLQLRYYFS